VCIIIILYSEARLRNAAWFVEVSACPEVDGRPVCVTIPAALLVVVVRRSRFFESALDFRVESGRNDSNPEASQTISGASVYCYLNL